MRSPQPSHPASALPGYAKGGRPAAEPSGGPPCCDELGRQLVQAILDGRGHEYLPFTGQSAGLIRDIVRAAVILERLRTEADAALRTAGAARTAV